MNKIAFSLVAGLALASSAFAGKEIKEYKEVVTPCFKDTELQLDLFGTWVDTTAGNHSDGWGGGVGINYFFTRYLGIGGDAIIYDGNEAPGAWQFSGSLIARFPVELGGLCLAPYLLGGGGYHSSDSKGGTLHAGGGVEFRIIPEKLGIYAEGRYTWVDGDNDNGQGRLGVRLVF